VRTVTFSIADGPNAGLVRTAETDDDGVARLTYDSEATGVDVVGASFTASDQVIRRSAGRASVTWTPRPVPTVMPTVVPTVVAPKDSDSDGVPDVSDNCVDVANRAGTTAQVAAISGDVYIKLPRTAKLSARLSRVYAREAQKAPIDGFIPIKGVATVPIGSEIDSRKGQLELKTAAKYDKQGQTSGLQQGRFAAGMFAVRQAAKRKAGASRKPSTQLVLLTPPGSARACAANSVVRPIKGVVRTLSSVAKGNFTTVGGASTTTATNGSWIVSDRCNGTMTEVGRGKVTVRDVKLKKTVTVRSGQGYLAKARLFAARQGKAAPPS
jgi:hypothetical protein